MPFRVRDALALDPVALAYAAVGVWTLIAVAAACSGVGGTQDAMASAVVEGAASSRAGAPPAPGAGWIAVEVASGSGADTIAGQLLASGVLAETSRFRALLGYSGAGARLQAGRYEFRAGSPAADVIRQMRRGLTRELVIVVPEGLRQEEVGELAGGLGIATPEEWAAALALPRAEPFLQGRPEGAGLTGYLFPATYPLGADTTAASLLSAMLDAFGEAVGPAVLARAEASGMTLHEVLTLASIVEREAVLSEEQPLVASVFRNRLDAGIALYADPTVQYAITEGFASRPPDGWWKRELTVEDLAFDSPWNTYLVAGLPPGPIASPGLGAILAALEPAETGYLYFVATGDGTGSHAFAETLAEHEANVARYRSR